MPDARCCRESSRGFALLKKRIAGVVVVKDGWAVQSFGYERYLPLGRPECLVENLDRWGADEIIVISIDRSSRGLAPDIALVRRLASLGLSTPLTFGGGIRSVSDAAAVIESGADRICVDALFWDDPDTVQDIARLLGAQAVVGVFPASVSQHGLLRRDYRTRTDAVPVERSLRLFRDRVVSEALLIDWRHEGMPLGFDPGLVAHNPVPETPLIAFGGLSSAGQVAELLARDQVVACAIGNFLSYREHAIQAYRRGAASLPVRPAAFHRETWQ